MNVIVDIPAVLELKFVLAELAPPLMVTDVGDRPPGPLLTKGAMVTELLPDAPGASISGMNCPLGSNSTGTRVIAVCAFTATVREKVQNCGLRPIGPSMAKPDCVNIMFVAVLLANPGELAV